MTRRLFIILSFYLLTKSLGAKKLSPTYWQMIDSTLNHLFPKSKKFEGASKLNFLSFLKLTTQNKYFNKDDLKFLIKGTKILYKMDKNYLNLSILKKERLLRKFEKSSIGQRWLATLLYYGFEAMMSDPVYGGNYEQKGWKALSHNAGIPRPKNRYGKNNV